jgi:hypothetical protein
MSSEEPSFYVVYSTPVRKKLKEILAKAKKVGKLDRFLRAALEIDERLHRDPFGLGELKGQLPRMNLQVHVGCVRPLAVEFGIEAEKKIVFVKRIQSITTLES